MCGKFTAKASWSEIVDFIHSTPPHEADGNDRTLTYRVMGPVPLIVWDPVAGKRRAVPMRWGFASRQNASPVVKYNRSFRQTYHSRGESRQL